jgi:hypothetical protein
VAGEIVADTERATRRAVVLLDDLPEHAPGVLYVLTLPESVAASDVVELRRTSRGPAAVVYSSVANLVAACGLGQPWASTTAERLQVLGDEHDYNLVVLDAWLPEGHRYPEPDVRDEPDLEPASPHSESGLLYVPSRRVCEGQQVVHLELQPDHAGRLMMLAFTSPEALAERCGPHQPWVAVARDDIDLVAEQAGALGVLLNPVLSEESRHTGPVQDWTRSSGISHQEGQ